MEFGGAGGAGARLDPAELAGARVQHPKSPAVQPRRMRHRQAADDDLACLHVDDDPADATFSNDMRCGTSRQPARYIGLSPKRCIPDVVDMPSGVLRRARRGRSAFRQPGRDIRPSDPPGRRNEDRAGVFGRQGGVAQVRAGPQCNAFRHRRPCLRRPAQLLIDRGGPASAIGGHLTALEQPERVNKIMNAWLA